MLLHRTIAEIATYCNDRDYYVSRGYTWEQASLLAYDHLFVNRRAAQGVYNGN